MGKGRCRSLELNYQKFSMDQGKASVVGAFLGFLHNAHSGVGFSQKGFQGEEVFFTERNLWSRLKSIPTEKLSNPQAAL